MRIQRESHSAGLRRLRRPRTGLVVVFGVRRSCRRFNGVRTSSHHLIGDSMAEGRIKVGIIGSQFQADIHAALFQMMPHEAEVVAIASPTPGNAAALAKRLGVPPDFTRSTTSSTVRIASPPQHFQIPPTFTDYPATL